LLNLENLWEPTESAHIGRMEIQAKPQTENHMNVLLNTPTLTPTYEQLCQLSQQAAQQCFHFKEHLDPLICFCD